MQQVSPSMFSVWGREDVGGLLTVSQAYMDRLADYESMEEYPDINCVAAGQRIYVVENSVIKPVPIEHLALMGTATGLLAYDVKKARLVVVDPQNPRRSGIQISVLEIPLSNGTKLRVTPDHKLLTVDGYVDAKDVSAGMELVGVWAGFDLGNTTMLINPAAGKLTIAGDPYDGGKADVFDITTETHNFVCEGAVVHNSAYHYYANDATQPSVRDNKTIWVASDERAIKGIGNDLLHKKLRVENEIWSQAYTLAMYGNNYEELLITENGVVGLNHLPAPTMRRVERLDGGLIGYVQDVTGQFTANGQELRQMLAGSTEIPNSLALFEDWQVAHMRLRATRRRSPYGVSVAEGARWIWKRLVMMEDSVMIYKLCLRGDSNIWTPDGHKAIKDLNEGDEVYSYTTEDKLKKTKVVYKKHNGQDTIYRVYSDHREIFANKTHPVLVETIEPQGNGRPLIRRLDYVEVQNLKPGVHRLVTPKKNDDDWEEIEVDQADGDVLTRVCVTYKVARQLGRAARSVPVEVFRASPQVKLGFISGVMRGQGLVSDEGVVTGSPQFLTDLRELSMQAGFEVGLVQQDQVTLSLYPQSPTEMIRGVEEIGTDDIWDIGVEADEHNFIADGAVVHNTRAPARYAFYVDVTDVPADRVEGFLRKFKRDFKKNKMVDPRTGRMTMRYSPLCLAGDTKVPLLDGSERSLVDMAAAHERGEDQWVYSVDVNDGNKLKPGKVAWAGKTRRDTQLLKITLDNGRSIKVTPDHKMIRRSGEFAEAQTLKVGDSLMPFYHRRGNTRRGNTSPSARDYEMVYDPSGRTYKFVRQVISEALGISNGTGKARAETAATNKEAGLAISHNHKVVRIEWLETREDTYTLTVEPAHTFAVSAGIFVKNSNDEDFVIGVREGRELARVEVLSGPDYQNVDDVEYFKKMLHGALRIPREYLGQDGGIPSRSILCLTGDTKVPLLDGRTCTMKELVTEYGNGGVFHTYSVGANGKVTAGRGHSPQVTRPNAEVWEVTLDNGEAVKGTPDHPFMLRDGSYRRLDELSPGDSLMPLYRRDSEKSRDGMDGYDMYLCPATGKWRFTHRSVASWKWRRLLKTEGRVIHHEDFDKRNNDPRNLGDPLAEEHLQIHRDQADKTIGRPEVRAKAIENSKWWTQSEECADLCRDNLEKARQPGGGQHTWCQSDEHRQLKSEQMAQQWREENSKLRALTQTDGFREASSKKMKESIALGKIKVRGEDNVKWRHDADYAHLVDVAKSYRCASFKDLTKWTGYSSCLIYRLLEREGITFKEFAEQHLAYGYDPGGHNQRRAEKALKDRQKALVSAGAPGNHKVVSVRKLDVREDCYDFVVDDCHNYALAAGVFVHNSNEDVRAARVTLNLQREIRLSYDHIIRVHLAARGVKDPRKPEFEVEMTIPSGIYEMAAYEVLNARADYASRVQPFVSTRWIQENVLRLSGEEIAAIEKQQKSDAEEEQAGEVPSYAGGQGAGAEGGEEEPRDEAPSEAPPEREGSTGTGAQAEKPKNPAEWRSYDKRRRLEEWRYRESNRRSEEILEGISRLGHEAAVRHRERIGFFKDLRGAALSTNKNGQTRALPSGRGRGQR